MIKVVLDKRYYRYNSDIYHSVAFANHNVDYSIAFGSQVIEFKDNQSYDNFLKVMKEMFNIDETAPGMTITK